MTWVLYVDVVVGLVLAAGVLMVSLMAGGERPPHRALWIVAVVLLAVRALFSAAMGVGVLVSSDRTWSFAIGALALVLMVPAAILRPRWTGIALLITAVLQPGLLFVLGRLGGVAEQEFPVEVMLVFYSLTVSVIGVLLIASTMTWGKAAEGDGRAAEVAPQPGERVSGS